MSEPEKRAVWPWIVALVIGLPVLYVASFGPACWITARRFPSEELVPHPVMTAYMPLGYFCLHAPVAVRNVVFRYAWLGVAPNGCILIRDFDEGDYILPRR